MPSAVEQSHGLHVFNELGEPEVHALLTACLAVPRWVAEVAGSRPYASGGDVSDTARAAAARLTPPEVAAALARHPRIGERADARHDAEFSAGEQSAVDPDDLPVAAALAAGNRRYEDRFDRVFLIRAAGRSAAEILAELDRRLTNDEDTELAEVVQQLTEIALLRLQQSVEPETTGSAPA